MSFAQLPQSLPLVGGEGPPARTDAPPRAVALPRGCASHTLSSSQARRRAAIHPPAKRTHLLLCIPNSGFTEFLDAFLAHVAVCHNWVRGERAVRHRLEHRSTTAHGDRVGLAQPVQKFPIRRRCQQTRSRTASRNHRHTIS